ncbi:hypothetical protein RJZ90_007573 [Blastomyces dermatitidis]
MDVAVKLVMKEVVRQHQFRTWKSCRGRNHGQGHAQQGPPGRSQVNVSFPDTMACREHILTDAEGLDCPGSDKENVEPSPSPPQSISTIPDNVSQDRPLRDIDATVSGSFRHPLEADTGCPHILLHREARDGSLELLLWAPIWRSEDDIAKVYPDQLKRYKERFGIRFAIRASQVGKRAPSPFPEPRRSFPSEKAAAELSLGIMPKSRAQID